MSERVTHATTGHEYRQGSTMYAGTLCGFLAPRDRVVARRKATCARCRRVIERERKEEPTHD